MNIWELVVRDDLFALTAHGKAVAHALRWPPSLNAGHQSELLEPMRNCLVVDARETRDFTVAHAQDVTFNDKSDRLIA